MKQYHLLLSKILREGKDCSDRTGIGRKRIIGEQLKFDLSEGFPLLTTKKVHFDSIVHELIWFLRGDTNIAYLERNNVTIWTDWAYSKYLKRVESLQSIWVASANKQVYGELKSITDSDMKPLTMKEFGKKCYTDEVFQKLGELGHIYGYQWRKYNGYIDQISNVKKEAIHNPNSSRMVVDSWNPAEIDIMALPPCHYSFQIIVIDQTLDLVMNMRSNDVFLGLPFNIAQYALLAHLFAHDCNYKLGTLTINISDAHLYLNHIAQAKELLSRDYNKYKLPTLMLDVSNDNGEGFLGKDSTILSRENIILKNYESYPRIKADVAV